jgi:two-component system, OmpR family, sensor kinase
VSGARRTTLRQAVRRVVVGQAGALMLLTLMSLVVFAAESGTAKQARNDQHELLLMQTARAEILTAQSAHRGFVLVGRPEFVEPYRSAVPAIDRTLSELKETEEDAFQVASELERRFEDWRAVFAEPTLRLLELDQRAAAQAIIQRGEGKRRIDEIKRVIAEASAHERDELDDLLALQERLGNIGRVVVVLASVGVLLFGAMLLRRLQRHVIEPVGKLADATQRLGDGDLSVRVREEGAQEVAVVGHAFNVMADDVGRHVAGLNELAEARSRFVASVAHELRGPLTSIRGFSEALIDDDTGPLNGDQRLSAQLVHRNAERMQRIVDDLLDLSRLEAGSVRLIIEPVELDVVLAVVIEELQPQLEPRALAVAADCEPGLIVHADPLRLHQALGNLFSNAVTFSAQGGHIRIGARRAGDVIVVEFADEGVGIPANELDRVGERFYRAPPRGAGPRARGSGWRSLGRSSNATAAPLSVRSRLAQGTVATVTLPPGQQTEAARPSSEALAR